MNQEEKIKAYLLNQLPPDETAAFRTEILQDPDLMGEVKATKLLLIAKELKYREELREKMKKWEGEVRGSAPLRETWVQRYGVSLVLGILVLGLVGYGIYLWTKPPPIPATPVAVQQYRHSSDTISSNGHGINDTIQIATFTQPPQMAFSDSQKLLKFANTLVRLKIKLYEKPKAIAGSSTQIEAPRERISSIMPVGFFWEHNKRNFILTSASSVSGASLEKGAVEGLTVAGERLSLTIRGRDELFDVAVLEIDKTPEIPFNTAFIDTAPIEQGTKNYLFAFETNKGLVKPEISKGATNLVVNNYFTAVAQTKWNNLDGPIFNEIGQVTGLISRYASDNLPEPTFGAFVRQAISGDLLYAVASKLVRLGNVQRPYIGAKIALDLYGNLTVIGTLPGSPASRKNIPKGAIVKSIDNIVVSLLSDVAYAILRKDAGDIIELTFTENGKERRTQVYTELMDNPTFKAIAEMEITQLKGYRLEQKIGRPSIVLSSDNQAGTAWEIFSCNIGGKSQFQKPILTAIDLGNAFQLMGLSGKGTLKALQTDNKKEITFPIKFNQAFIVL